MLRAPLGPQSSSVMCTKKKEEGMMENMVPHVKLFSLNSFYDKYDIFVAPLQITALFSSASMSCPSSEGENQTTSLLAPLSFGNLFGFGRRRRQKKNVNHPNTIWSFKRCPSPPFRLMTIFFLCRVKPSFFKNVLDFLMNFRVFF